MALPESFKVEFEKRHGVSVEELRKGCKSFPCPLPIRPRPGERTRQAKLAFHVESLPEGTLLIHSGEGS